MYQGRIVSSKIGLEIGLGLGLRSRAKVRLKITYRRVECYQGTQIWYPVSEKRDTSPNEGQIG